MTKELLEQYPDICGELEDVERKLHQLVTDTVSCSGSEFPFTQHTVSIQGIQPELLADKARLQAQKQEIERFIRGLPNSKLRRIVDYKVVQCMTWEQVAAKMGYWRSVKSLQNDYYRMFDEK